MILVLDVPNHEAIGQRLGPSLAELTPRELEVLELISAGATNSEAASFLGLSVHAIKFHLARIYRRLGVTNRTEAAIRYYQSLSRPPAPGD